MKYLLNFAQFHSIPANSNTTLLGPLSLKLNELIMFISNGKRAFDESPNLISPKTQQFNLDY